MFEAMSQLVIQCLSVVMATVMAVGKVAINMTISSAICSLTIITTSTRSLIIASSVAWNNPCITSCGIWGIFASALFTGENNVKDTLFADKTWTRTLNSLFIRLVFSLHQQVGIHWVVPSPALSQFLFSSVFQQTTQQTHKTSGKMRKNRTLPRKSTELIDSQEREQVLRRWVDLAMKERLRLGTLNGNRSWKPALQAVQKEAKIPECFVKGDKLNQFLEEAFKLAVEKYGHLNTTTVKIPSPRVNQKEEDDRGAEDQCNSVADSPRREEGTSVVPKGKIDSDSVSADGVKERTNSQVALLFDCISRGIG
ncbi:hypothetical protein QOT17_025194 [Balamuthia mandrillaris]